MASRCGRCGSELREGEAPGASPVCPACAVSGSPPTLHYPEGTPPLRAPKPSEWEELPPETAIGPYRITGALGQGGMGTVYRAVQPGLDRTVAIKVLPRQLARDHDFVARFNREARTLAALNHPNIVGVFDLGCAGESYFFCMEFVDGQSLRHLLRQGPLPQEEVLRLGTQICDALAYAHAEGVVHRDIKPENVLLDRRGRVKIADFGLARIVRGETPLEPLTRTNTVMGTVEYMAPEQRESSRDVDYRVDLYSLGVMLYEMLTGKLPVGRWEMPSRQAGSDPRLDEIVLRCLEHDPRRRWSGAAELAARLAEVARGPAVAGETGIVLPHQRREDAAAALPPERREVVVALAEALAPLGFVRYGRTLPPAVALDEVFIRSSAETVYLVAVAPWPALQPATADNLRAHAGLVRAGILGLLADVEAAEHRVLSTVFTGFPDELSDDFAAALKKLIDRTSFHDLTFHSVVAVDPRASRVHYHRSAFAFWSQRDVPERVLAGARSACEAIGQQRRADTAARSSEAHRGRLGLVESALLAARYERVWWHESRPGLEVLSRAWLRPGSGEQAQLVVLRDLPPGRRAPDRRWVQNQADLLRSAIHTVAPSLRWQEYLVVLCIGGTEPLDAAGERALGRALNALRLDAVSIQGAAYVAERSPRTHFQSSMSPHYYGHNQTVDTLRRALRALPQEVEGGSALAPTRAPGLVVPSEVKPKEPTVAPAAPAGAAGPVACPVQNAIRSLLVPGPNGIAGASFVDIVAESARFLVGNFWQLLGASLLLQVVGIPDVMLLMLGPLSNAYLLMVIRALREGRKPRLGDLTLACARLPVVTLAFWLIAPPVALGLFCGGLPGAILGTWSLFALPLLVETNCGIWRALRESKRLVSWRGFWPHFWLFALVAFFLLEAGRIATDLSRAAIVAVHLFFALITPVVLVPIAVAYEGARAGVPAAPEAALPPPREKPTLPPAPSTAPTRMRSQPQDRESPGTDRSSGPSNLFP